MSVIEIEKCSVLPYGVCAACISRRLILPSCIHHAYMPLLRCTVSRVVTIIAAPIGHPYPLSCIIPSSAPRPQKFSDESLEFQRRISQRNGLSEETYLPPALHTLPPNVTMETAREEARMVLFGAVQDVLDRTGNYSP